jgi:aspartate/methionine/tyrosine aminotransferase
MQRAGITAIERGESFVEHQIARARRGRDVVAEALAATGRCRFALPQGAFYLFFSVDGESDMRRLAFRIIDEAKVGLAPGTAFGAGGENFLRLCFARNPDQLADAAQRVAEVLTRPR